MKNGFVRWNVYRSRASATFVVVMNVVLAPKIHTWYAVAPSTGDQRTSPGCGLLRSFGTLDQRVLKP